MNGTPFSISGSSTKRHGRSGRRRAATLTGLAAATLLLAGCGGWRQTFGLDHAPPDEFTVVAQAPLSMPPDFALRPPRPGSVRPQDVGTTAAAESAVFGIKQEPGTARVRGAASPGESVFLAQAGAGAAQPNIRATIDAETRNLVAADKHWVDRLMFWQKQEPPVSTVDPAAEAKRLRDNAALGQPVTTGNTPTIERKRKAPLEGIF